MSLEPVYGTQSREQFESHVVAHMGAAYNLARWLTRNDHDAEDVVQEAYLRAFRFWESFRGADPRAWLLTIVRNTCFTWLHQNRKPSAELDENMPELNSANTNPEVLLLANVDAALLRRAVEELPIEFREAIVLRELEGFSYKEISSITSVPIGTVMSRLARARTRLLKVLQGGAA
ncbi:MAG TPA: sigma-70 family RNA polymerase sigma factor [Bryobacteraceae bacterium]|nr:sigma-70 family RNA polymerase sigma factor [Bryobacteraceae bacterium]